MKRATPKGHHKRRKKRKNSYRSKQSPWLHQCWVNRVSNLELEGKVQHLESLYREGDIEKLIENGSRALSL